MEEIAAAPFRGRCLPTAVRDCCSLPHDVRPSTLLFIFNFKFFFKLDVLTDRQSKVVVFVSWRFDTLYFRLRV